MESSWSSQPAAHLDKYFTPGWLYEFIFSAGSDWKYIMLRNLGNRAGTSSGSTSINNFPSASLWSVTRTAARAGKNENKDFGEAGSRKGQTCSEGQLWGWNFWRACIRPPVGKKIHKEYKKATANLEKLRAGVPRLKMNTWVRGPHVRSQFGDSLGDSGLSSQSHSEQISSGDRCGWRPEESRGKVWRLLPDGSTEGRSNSKGHHLWQPLGNVVSLGGSLEARCPRTGLVVTPGYPLPSMYPGSQKEGRCRTQATWLVQTGEAQRASRSSARTGQTLPKRKLPGAKLTAANLASQPF